MKNFDYLIGYILYHIFKIILNIYLKKHGEKTVNTSMRVYANKIENRITFKIKTGCYIEFLTPKTMKLFESSKRKITKDENGEYVPC